MFTMNFNAAILIFVSMCCLIGLSSSQNNYRFYPYNYEIKEGSCSPLLSRQVCWNSCQGDYDCPEVEKCCGTSCGGTVCSRPVSERKKPDLVKPGECPQVPGGPWFCSSTCRSDGDCYGSKKCCRNACGALGCYKAVKRV